MRALDEVYTATPFYGLRRLQVALRRQGRSMNRKRVQRLMRLMGIEAIGPKPRLSQRHRGHQVYSYLLRDMAIERIDQVWSCDITYIRLRSGFVYLVAVLDWFSRCVLYGLGSCIWWRSWIGSAAASLAGSCRSLWTVSSAETRSNAPWRPGGRRFSKGRWQITPQLRQAASYIRHIRPG